MFPNTQLKIFLPNAFQLWCWRRLLRVLWTARISNQSILKEINPIHWKDWCRSWSFNTLATWYEEPTHCKRPWCWERLKAGREGDDKDEMVGWHHRLNGHEFEQTPGDSEGQGSLMCCSSRSHKELGTTDWLNNNFLIVPQLRNASPLQNPCIPSVLLWFLYSLKLFLNRYNLYSFKEY